MPTLPSEDIGAVLERFHKWAGNHAEPVRELTYEEAMKRSRRRVYDEEEPVPPEPAKAATPEPSPQTSAASQPAAVEDKATKPRSTSRGKSQKKAAAAKPGRSGNKTTQNASRKAAAKPSRKKPSVTAPEATKHTTSTATAYSAAHQAEEEIMPPSAPTPSFEQVLAAHIPMDLTQHGISASMHSIPPLPPDAPTVHLTVRLTAEERNAIRERAHDLGITPAAYLRHCGLEIDALRAELEAVRLACAHVAGALPADSLAIEGNASLSLRRPAPRHYPAKESWLRRLMRIILPGRAKGRTLSTSA